MSQQPVVQGGGIGVMGILGCIFITLKLMGYITWSWWWVTAPFWGGFALFLIFFFIAIFFAGFFAGIVALLDKK